VGRLRNRQPALRHLHRDETNSKTLQQASCRAKPDLMVAKQKIIWWGVLLYLVIQGLAIASIGKLEQRNAETLFFYGKGVREHREFLKHFQEQKLILVKTSFPAGLDQERYQAFENNLQALRNKFPDVELVTFFDIYRISVKQDDLKTILDFVQGH